jgi:hypothetical protein
MERKHALDRPNPAAKVQRTRHADVHEQNPVVRTFGSRTVDLYEKEAQIGEGTYGYVEATMHIASL